jgi:K+-sensing histidine kinase KdpD
MFLLVVIPIAHVSGAITGVLASVTAGLAFALVLFRPFGSLHIENLADRLNLAFFAVASVAVACLSSSAFRTQPSVSRQDR